jgi:hypothetical protein
MILRATRKIRAGAKGKMYKIHIFLSQVFLSFGKICRFEVLPDPKSD